MISPYQEGNSSPEALRRSAACKVLEIFSSRCASGQWFLVRQEPDIHLRSRPGRASPKIECVISCQSRNISEWASGSDLPCPVGFGRDLAGTLKTAFYTKRSSLTYAFKHLGTWPFRSYTRRPQHSRERLTRCCSSGINGSLVQSTRAAHNVLKSWQNLVAWSLVKHLLPRITDWICGYVPRLVGGLAYSG